MAEYPPRWKEPRLLVGERGAQHTGCPHDSLTCFTRLPPVNDRGILKSPYLSSMIWGLFGILPVRESPIAMVVRTVQFLPLKNYQLIQWLIHKLFVCHKVTIQRPPMNVSSRLSNLWILLNICNLTSQTECPCIILYPCQCSRFKDIQYPGHMRDTWKNVECTWLCSEIVVPINHQQHY